jgi:hypothetical protein
VTFACDYGQAPDLARALSRDVTSALADINALARRITLDEP